MIETLQGKTTVAEAKHSCGAHAVVKLWSPALVWPLLQGGDCRRVHGCSVAKGGDGFQCHVAPCDRPLVIMFQHQGAEQTCDGGFVGEDSHDVGAPLDLLVEAFQRVRGMDLALVAA